MYLPAPRTTFSSSFSQTILPPAIVTSTFPCIKNKKEKEESIDLTNWERKAVAMFEKRRGQLELGDLRARQMLLKKNKKQNFSRWLNYRKFYSAGKHSVPSPDNRNFLYGIGQLQLSHEVRISY